jgi:prefoldin subunit 5
MEEMLEKTLEKLKFALEKVNEELTNLSVYNFIYDPDMVEKIKQLNADKISLENKIKSLEDIKE